MPALAHIDYRGPLISTNRAYRRGRGRGLFLTREAKTFKDQLALAGRKAMNGQAPTGRLVAVTVDYFFRMSTSDVDGPTKLVLDALQGVAYVNDRQVVEVLARKHKAQAGGVGAVVRVSLVDGFEREAEA